MADAVDWLAYFQNIKEVCPWSYSAVLQGKIRIETWHSHILDLGTDKAVVYLAPNHKPRQLKRISDRLNHSYSQYEFLWSHPKYQGNSTPVPVIIQQDAQLLEKIRKQTGFSRTA